MIFMTGSLMAAVNVKILLIVHKTFVMKIFYGNNNNDPPLWGKCREYRYAQILIMKII